MTRYRWLMRRQDLAPFSAAEHTTVRPAVQSGQTAGQIDVGALPSWSPLERVTTK